ncbi:hypothetical protein OH492_20545 [Vibrio chagasii]|nr:hypothetical protein [Vibrio chagasii]
MHKVLFLNSFEKNASEHNLFKAPVIENYHATGEAGMFSYQNRHRGVRQKRCRRLPHEGADVYTVKQWLELGKDLQTVYDQI